MPKPVSYKRLADELQQVTSDLESGELDIDEAVKCYERGLEIVRELETQLKTAENRVEELKASSLQETDGV